MFLHTVVLVTSQVQCVAQRGRCGSSPGNPFLTSTCWCSASCGEAEHAGKRKKAPPADITRAESKARMDRVFVAWCSAAAAVRGALPCSPGYSYTSSAPGSPTVNIASSPDDLPGTPNTTCSCYISALSLLVCCLFLLRCPLFAPSRIARYQPPFPR